MKAQTFTNDQGRTFTVRVVYKGELAGTSFKFAHEESEPCVEFYDTTCPFTPFGQFVSAYYLSTLLQHRPLLGLILHGGVPEWVIDAATFDRIRDWLEAN